MEIYTDANETRWLRGLDENGGDTAISLGIGPSSNQVAVALQMTGVSGDVVRVTLSAFPRIADSFTIQGTVAELMALVAPPPPPVEPPADTTEPVE